MLWRSRWVLFVCVVAALSAGFLYISTTTPIYTSTAKLYLDYENIPISTSFDLGRAPQTDRYLHTQAELLRSRPILATAMETLLDQRLNTFRDVEVPVAYVHKNVVVEVGKKDETVSVSFDSPYPVEAAQIVNTVVDTYMTTRSENEREDATKVLNILQSDMQARRSELDKKRNELKDFQANDMPLALGSEQGGGVMQSHLEYQSAYTQAQAARIQARQYRDAVQDLAGSPAALQQYLRASGRISEYMGAGRERASLEAKLTELDIRKEQLLETLTADHPAVAVTCAEMERIAQKLDALNQEFVEATIAAAEQQYTQAKANEEQQASLYEEQKAKVRLLSTELFQYRQLLSEVEWLQGSVQTLEQQVDEVRKIVGEDIGQMRMEILETAQRAEEPSKPQKAKIMAMALVLGLFVGGGIGIARDWLDQTLRSADDIAVALQLPVLGVVPAMSHRQKMQLRGQRVLLQPESSEAEAFRTVRTAVFFGASKGKAKTLLVTSPSAGDGKSTLVSNLGIAMANAGQRVLVLDADFRKPMQHRIFEVNHEERSIASILAGQMTLTEAIQPTQVEGLDLLVCGQGVSNPAEVLNSREFAGLLSEAAATYDRVILDAPPVTVVTDAQILGAICDRAILVLKADKSTRSVARRAIEALESVGAELLGAVVNEVKKSGGRYGYYGRYAGSYGNGSDNGGGKKARVGEAGRRRLATNTVSKSEA